MSEYEDPARSLEEGADCGRIGVLCCIILATVGMIAGVEYRNGCEEGCCCGGGCSTGEMRAYEAMR